jgi:outer membrane receptor protein involved in Fe transport
MTLVDSFCRFSRRFVNFLPVAGFMIPSTAISGEQILEEIVVTGRALPASHALIPGSVGYLSSEENDKLDHVHVNESLGRVPGVWMSRGNGQEHLTAIRSPVLTGPGSCGSFLFLEDSIPVRPAVFCNVNQMFEMFTNWPSRIEVLKGPGSAVYGSNAVHGVVNVVSPEIDADEYQQLGVTVGHHDYGRLRYSVNRSEEGFDGLRFDGYFTHNNGFQDDTGFDEQKISLKHQHQGDRVRLTSRFVATNLNQETGGYVEGQDAYRHAGERRDNQNPEAYRDADSFRGYHRIEISRDGEPWAAITPYYRSSRMEFIQHWNPGLPVERNGQDSIGLDSRFFYSPAEKHRLTSGFSVEAARVDVRQHQQQASLPFGGFVTGTHYDFEVDTQTVAVFSELDTELSEKNRLVSGIRVEHHDLQYDNQTGSGLRGRYFRPGSDHDSFAGGGLNLAFIRDYVPGHQFLVQGSHGYRVPQIAELYRLESGQSPENLNGEKILEKLPMKGWNLACRSMLPRQSGSMQLSPMQIMNMKMFPADS